MSCVHNMVASQILSLSGHHKLGCYAKWHYCCLYASAYHNISPYPIPSTGQITVHPTFLQPDYGENPAVDKSDTL